MKQETSLPKLLASFSRTASPVLEAKMRAKALAFAQEAHGKGSYYEEPYLVHPLRVAIILVREFGIRDRTSVLAALFHDILEENTLISQEDIASRFGEDVARAVWYLTREPGNSRAEEIHAYLQKLSRAPESVLMVKLADRLDNLRSSFRRKTKKQIRHYYETRAAFLPLVPTSATQALATKLLQEEGRKIKMLGRMRKLLKKKSHGLRDISAAEVAETAPCLGKLWMGFDFLHRLCGQKASASLLSLRALSASFDQHGILANGMVQAREHYLVLPSQIISVFEKQATLDARKRAAPAVVRKLFQKTRGFSLSKKQDWMVAFLKLLKSRRRAVKKALSSERISKKSLRIAILKCRHLLYSLEVAKSLGCSLLQAEILCVKQRIHETETLYFFYLLGDSLDRMPALTGRQKRSFQRMSAAASGELRDRIKQFNQLPVF